MNNKTPQSPSVTAPLQGSLYERVKKVPIMNYTLLMELVSRIGCGIAMGGAETYRVEESVNRILGAYGVESRVYSVPNSLIITIIIPDQPPMTQLCRMERKGTEMLLTDSVMGLCGRVDASNTDGAEILFRGDVCHACFRRERNRFR